MLRKLTVVLGLTMSLLVTRQASAIPVDLDRLRMWASPTPTSRGPLGPVRGGRASTPYDGRDHRTACASTEACTRTCTTVNPDLDDNFASTLQLTLRVPRERSGWSFSQAAAAGGSGTVIDFLYFDRPDKLGIADRLVRAPPSLGWDAGEPITFFFVSTRPPSLGDYNLIG